MDRSMESAMETEFVWGLAFNSLSPVGFPLDLGFRFINPKSRSPWARCG